MSIVISHIFIRSSMFGGFREVSRCLRASVSRGCGRSNPGGAGIYACTSRTCDKRASAPEDFESRVAQPPSAVLHRATMHSRLGCDHTAPVQELCTTTDHARIRSRYKEPSLLTLSAGGASRS